MRHDLLDTGIAGDYVYRRGPVYARAQRRKALGDKIGICTPVLGELWAGVEASATSVKNRPVMRREVSRLVLWPFDKAAAEEFGRLAALLKSLGRPMPAADIQIAAVALTLGNCTLITRDSDFKAIPGLSVEDWSIP